MVISTDKTKAVIIAAMPVRCKLEVDNEIVQESTNLGITIKPYGLVGREISCHITK